MSMCYRRTKRGYSFYTQAGYPWPSQSFLPKLEETLAPFEPRPHWGKLFTLAPSVLHSRYERYRDFITLAAQYDPEGKFRNAFMNENFFA
jgi:xylitol oxidase